MGVYKRKDIKGNPWCYRFYINGESYHAGGFSTWRAARDAEIERERIALAALSTGTFLALVNRRLNHVRAYCTPKHYKDNVCMLRSFKEWGILPVSEITTKKIQDRLFQLLADGMTNHNVNRHLRALRSVFQVALREGQIGKDPTASLPYLPVEKPVKYVPTKADVAKILMRATSAERAYITVVWLTAARVSEINNLPWEDVQLEEGTLQLWTRKKRFGNRVARTIKMIEPVRKAFKYMWKIRTPGSPWVFTNPQMVEKYPDEPEKWKYGYRRRLIRRLTKGLDKPFTYHNLRHSAASILASLNADIPTIQFILGHESATTTNRYMQSLPHGVVIAMGDLEREVIDVFD